MISDEYGEIVEQMIECRRKAVEGGYKVPIDFSDYPEDVRPPEENHH